jgi:hypothetical protein
LLVNRRLRIIENSELSAFSFEPSALNFSP